MRITHHSKGCQVTLTKWVPIDLQRRIRANRTVSRREAFRKGQPAIEQLPLPGFPHHAVWDDVTNHRRNRKHIEFRLYMADDGKPKPELYVHYQERGKLTLTSYGFSESWTIDEIHDTVSDILMSALSDLDPF